NGNSRRCAAGVAGVSVVLKRNLENRGEKESALGSIRRSARKSVAQSRNALRHRFVIYCAWV
ncbi:hypothetical protein, partial [Rhodococcus qingshengii]|uniref:hypothetical protein n=1 Tax=Rhodococcus qingshengii TaxID=334542 RepID=UPI002AFDF74A